jgi:serine/threonine-protein kinase
MSKLLGNRFRILKTLAEGGFGHTFLAEDTHMPSRRQCVVKQLKPIARPDQYQLVKERFEREAFILEKLGESSDQLPKLYAFFNEEGQFHLVQEWIEGLTLTQLREKTLLKEGYIGEDIVRKIIVNLLNVLKLIHARKVIHRDIKPDNIIIRQRDNKVILIDFGIVKEVARLDAFGNPTSSIIAGTGGYMALEQAAGRPVFASDIYSVGMTAIYLQTGKNPLTMINPHTGEVEWHKYDEDSAEGFAAIIDKAIEPLVRDRYKTTDEMLDDLKKLKT